MALHYAAREGHLDAVQALLDLNVSPDETTVVVATSRTRAIDIARATAMVPRQSQSPLRGSRLPTAMLMKKDSSGRNGMM